MCTSVYFFLLFKIPKPHFKGQNESFAWVWQALVEALFWLYSVVANVQLFRITSKKSLRAALFSDLPESSRAASSTSTAEAAQEYWPFPYQRATKYYPVYEWNWPFSPFFLLCLFGARAAAFRPRWGLKTSKSTKKDMTAVVIPRGNWMLLFFSLAQLWEKVAFLGFLGFLRSQSTEIHPSSGFDMSSTRHFLLVRYHDTILRKYFWLYCQAKKYVYQRKFNHFWEKPTISSPFVRTQKH